jgi:hemerythrin-like domain-containing protein
MRSVFHQGMDMKLSKDPLKILLQEHQDGLGHLARLEQAAESIQANGFSAEAIEEIIEAVRWMNNDVREHIVIEERYLFPAIERHGSDLPDSMRNDHHELRGAFSQFLEIVQEIERGRMRGSSIHEIVQISLHIVTIMRSHIARENELLFPLAKRLLSVEELNIVADKMGHEGS